MRLAPFVLVAVGEVVLRELAQVVAVRPEVVVDHVEDHAQADGVGAVDEAAKVVGRAIEPRGREQVDAVVAPAEAAGKVGHRHHLEDRDAQRGQLGQLPLGRRPGPFRRERADVHLVDHLAVAGHAAPGRVGPAEGGRVDDLRRPVRAVRLETRSRIGIGPLVAVETKLVEHAGPGLLEAGRPIAVPLGGAARVRSSRAERRCDHRRRSPPPPAHDGGPRRESELRLPAGRSAPTGNVRAISMGASPEGVRAYGLPSRSSMFGR